MLQRVMLVFVILQFLLVGTGCDRIASATITNTTTPVPVTSVPPTQTPSAVPTLTQTPTADPTAGFQLISPLKDISLSELPEIVTTDEQHFHPPQPGQDDGHFGVDFAYWSREGHPQMEGLPIYSILNGVVAGVAVQLKPYGNMIMIETPLSSIPAEVLASLSIPGSLSPYPSNPRINCPDLSGWTWKATPASLYLLYAHMKDPTMLKVGDVVNAGDQIGLVGTTGNSVNPHLHLEMRFGPAGTIFASMGHYDTSATPEEMAAYCLWRVSGQFVAADPLTLLQSPHP